MEILETQRLYLREWKDEDKTVFTEINADPRVMEFLGDAWSPQWSHDWADMKARQMKERGYGLYAVEIRENGKFIGFCGLQDVNFDAPFTPAVEIGWRLAREHWGKGYATEAATTVIRHAFATLGMEGLVSFTVPENKRSRRVMEKIGMTHCPQEDFVHPMVAAGSRLAGHVLYRLKKT